MLAHETSFFFVKRFVLFLLIIASSLAHSRGKNHTLSPPLNLPIPIQNFIESPPDWKSTPRKKLEIIFKCMMAEDHINRYLWKYTSDSDLEIRQAAKRNDQILLNMMGELSTVEIDAKSYQTGVQPSLDYYHYESTVNLDQSTKPFPSFLKDDHLTCDQFITEAQAR